MAHLLLFQPLDRGRVLTASERLEHAHDPDALIEQAARLREVGEPGDHGGHLVLDSASLVLLQAELNVLYGAAEQVQFERSR